MLHLHHNTMPMKGVPRVLALGEKLGGPCRPFAPAAVGNLTGNSEWLGWLNQQVFIRRWEQIVFGPFLFFVEFPAPPEELRGLNF